MPFCILVGCVCYLSRNTTYSVRSWIWEAEKSGGSEINDDDDDIDDNDDDVVVDDDDIDDDIDDDGDDDDKGGYKNKSRASQFAWVAKAKVSSAERPRKEEASEREMEE